LNRKETLAGKLKATAVSGKYPFHMPGHKRNVPEKIGELLRDPFSFDTTETEETDNLHHAAGILKTAMDHAAEVYRTRKTCFLVNGSTCGIQAAILSCVKPGDHILMASNSHLSAYRAKDLAGAVPVFADPPVLSPYGFAGSINPEDTERILKKDKKIRAVFITSPTYEGILSDVKTIAGQAHKAGIPLIVDEAHGAHLFFLPVEMRKEYGLCSAAECGADIVIQSLHKTLPALTQTALLHVCSDRADVEKIRKYLSVFETSSPSYVLMASIDACVRWMEKDGRSAMKKYAARLEKSRNAFLSGRRFSLWVPGESEKENGSVYAFDPGKLVFGAEGKNDLTGRNMASLFRKAYGIETEMAGPGYVLAMTSVSDTEEGFTKLEKAVRETDLFLCGERISAAAEKILREEERKPASGIRFPKGEVRDYIYCYPPGIPVAVPGEILSSEKKTRITAAALSGCQVMGVERYG